ncbi:hypothetical protein ACFL1C_07265 [Pseudomonadota bacterium]|jgi:hypothetical protein
MDRNDVIVAFGGPMETPEKPSISTSQKMKLTALVEALALSVQEIP